MSISKKDYHNKEEIILPNEIWKPIKGYGDRYIITNLGRVISYKYGGYKELKPQINKKGYLTVKLRNKEGEKRWSIHRLVAIAFIPNPNNLPVINHKDENPLNNHVENLEWCTQKYNMNYGTCKSRISKASSKPVTQFDLNGNWIKNWPNIITASQELNLNNTNVSKCCNILHYTTGHFLWRFTIPEYGPGYILKVPKKSNYSTPITQFDLNGCFVKNWISVREIQNNTGIDRQQIQKCCRGQRYEFEQFIWKYYNPKYNKDYNILNIDPNEIYDRSIIQIEVKTKKIIQRYVNIIIAFRTVTQKTGNVNGWQLIYSCCKKLSYMAYGYMWEFEFEYIK